MKFHLLPIGASFEFKGEKYIKAGPFSAVHKTTGEDQMMMRAANITPLDEGEDRNETQSTKPVELDPAEIRNAIDDYHQQCLNALQQQPPEAEAILNTAREKLIKRLTAGQ